ncbi:hypothetical protein ACTXNH_01320 [Psychrobacter celer]|uniref:Cap15 family cyclic dinucleotide receptor domain-containing protein n=1 Tax=Psychrobacter celer TaxID=306572 RepID=UPI003FD4C390
MINLLPIGKLISLVAVMYAVVTGLILLAIYDKNTSFMTAISTAISGSTLLNFLLLAVFYFGWQVIWKICPALNKILFPNLNGTWDMVIHYEWEGKKGTSNAKAVITQNFLKIGMDVEAEDSDSQTLMAKPKKDAETGRAELYYIFLTTPKDKGGSKSKTTYKGAAILKLNLHCDQKMEGNYFTDRETCGYYELERAKT